jgi:hypothetical protein
MEQHGQIVAGPRVGTNLVSSADVNGALVFSPEGEQLGRIGHLMIDRITGRIVYAVMNFGGFLGLGANEHPIPWQKLRYDGRPHRSYSPASSTSTVTMSPGTAPRNLVDEEVAVDLRRVGLGAAGGALFVHLVDDDLDHLPTLAASLASEIACAFSMKRPSGPASPLGHMIGQVVRPRPGDVFVLEAADPVELRLVQPVEQGLELGLGLARIADDEGRAQDDIGAVRGARRRSRPASGPRRRGGPCGAAHRGGRAGTGCRDRAGSAPRPSAASGRAHAGRDRHNAAAPRRPACPSRQRQDR